MTDAAAASSSSSSTTSKINPTAEAGADLGKYSWTQRLSDVTMTIPVAAGTRGKDIVCKVTDKRISVKVKGVTVVEGDFRLPVRAGDTFWSLHDQRNIVVEIAKQNTMEWWSGVLKGDPEIDTTKVKPEDSRLSDLDGDTRKMVEKMMYDQHQKMAGLPTSEEQEKARILEQFKSQHPELDFSQAKMT